MNLKKKSVLEESLPFHQAFTRTLELTADVFLGVLQKLSRTSKHKLNIRPDLKIILCQHWEKEVVE